MHLAIFFIATYGTMFCLWYFYRKQLAHWWDTATLFQHRVFVCASSTSSILLLSTIMYLIFYEWGNWDIEPPLWTAVVGFLTIQHLVIGALATENRGKRLKRINEHYRFKALLRRPPPTPAPEPTPEDKIRELIKQNKR